VDSILACLYFKFKTIEDGQAFRATISERWWSYCVLVLKIQVSGVLFLLSLQNPRPFGWLFFASWRKTSALWLVGGFSPMRKPTKPI